MFAAILLSLVLAASPQDSPFERVAVIGASVAGGWGLRGDWGFSMKLDDIYGASLVEAPETMLDLGSTRFFLDPVGRGTEQVAKAVAAEPTLVVAVDFLFWYGWGHQHDALRLQRLERGLRELEKFECPVLVGDLPDMSPATEATMPLIVPPQVPSPEMRLRLNARVHEWAKERDHVVLVPLADFVKTARHEQRLELRGNVWDGDLGALFLQLDLLHPTVAGDIALTVLLHDALLKRFPDWEEHVVVDAEEIEARLRAAKAEQLKVVEERKKKRAEAASARE